MCVMQRTVLFVLVGGEKVAAASDRVISPESESSKFCAEDFAASYLLASSLATMISNGTMTLPKSLQRYSVS